MLSLKFDDYVFSIKCFIAAMAALYAAMAMGLPKPFWAMTTTYIVSQPWSGAVRSKAVYRLVGTVLGSMLTVYIVPKFVDYPIVFTLLVMGWIGGCLYISVLDKTPRSYMFMLAGYTAAMIAFPSVTHPDQVFDIALARMQEISLGIVIATVVHSVLFPKHFSPVFLFKVDVLIKDIKRCLGDLFTKENGIHDRRALANDIIQLHVLATHIPFDTGYLRWTHRWVSNLQTHLNSLLPFMTTLEHELERLSKHELGVPDNINELLKTLEEDLEAYQTSSIRWIRDLLLKTKRVSEQYAAQKDLYAAYCLSVCIRLQHVLEEYLNSIRINNHLRRVDHKQQAQSLADLRPKFSRRDNNDLHKDHFLAFRSALAVMVAIAVCVAFWYLTSWSGGPNAVLMAAIFSSFFAAQDDPTPGIKLFFKFTLYSLPLSAFYLLIVLPAVTSFEGLAISLLPILMAIGAFIPGVSTSGKAMALILGFSGSLAMYDTSTPTMIDFLNMMGAQLFGLVVAMQVALIFRRFSIKQRIEHIDKAIKVDLKTLCFEEFDRVQISRIRAVILDRIGMLQSRFSQAKTGLNSIDNTFNLSRLALLLLDLRECEIPASYAFGIKQCLRDLYAITFLDKPFLVRNVSESIGRIVDELLVIDKSIVQQKLLVCLLGLQDHINNNFVKN